MMRQETKQIQTSLVQRPRQRGSVLIIVIGMLALMSVTTVVYLSIGRGDRRASGIVVQKNDIEDSMVRFGDYIASIVADDVVATFVDGEADFGSGPEPVIRREATDYPWTDYQMRSDKTSLVNDEYPFNPIGTFDELWTGSGVVDIRQPSDPWLAAIEPTWLNFSTGTPTAPTNQQILESSRDWAQISNVAPDGRFVNLFNLRGNFDAEPGEGVDIQGNDRMSEDMTLFEEPATPDSRAIPGAGLDFGGTLDLDTPAFWGMRQRAMFRPIGVGAVDGEWSDSEFHLYQYADADGDGMIDSRFIEPKDASDPMNIVSILPEDDRYRYFLGVRIIDLSGLINLNTATDFREPPTYSTPAGMFPSEIDLRRLLTSQDSYGIFAAIPGVEFGYEFLDRPDAPGLGEADYSGVDVVTAYDIGALGYNGLRTTIWDGLGTLYNADERAEFYLDYGAGRSGVVSGGGTSYFLGSPFTMDDHLELFTYRGVNNPESLTNLERALGAPGMYSVLRDNRSLRLERGGMDNEGYTLGLPNGAPDDDAMIWSQIDPRQRLTTVSGARPLISGIVPLGDEGRLHTDVDLVPGLFGTDDAFGNTGGRLQKLFELYANALAPYLDEQAVSARWSGADVDKYRTLNFGHARPDLALRLAAHMSLNIADSYDGPETGNHEPLAATLLLTDDPSMSINDPLMFPWWTAPASRLDLPDQLAPLIADLGGNPAAINIFGIEPQPFLAEVAHAIMYTDAPNAAGGDEDGSSHEPPPPGPSSFGPAEITIRGTVNTANVDFLMEAVAFQITNPFDVPMSLAIDNAGTIEPIYYIEFGGKIYAPDVPLVDSTLPPGETKVFYALSQETSLIQGRWNNVSQGSPPPGDAEVQQWIVAQLGLRDSGGSAIDPVRLTEFDPETGLFQTAASLNVTQLLSPIAAENRVAHLWRTMLPAGETFNNNRRQSDLLADRLRDPVMAPSETLNNRMPASNQFIDGTKAGPEGSAFEEDNSGFSITLWSSIRRPSDSGAAAATGGLPAWCIEVNTAWSGNGSPTRNDAEQDTMDPDSLNDADFSSDVNGYTTMALLVSNQAPVTPVFDDALNETLVSEPKDKVGALIGGNLRSIPESYSDLRPQVHLDNKEFGDVSGGTLRFRTADLLLPMAVGPYQDPLAGNPDEEWTTLSEALALALYYDARPPGDTFFELAGDAAGVNPSKVDRGQLALYDFVPFLNENNDAVGVYERDQGDLVRYPGIPLAMNVLNMARTMDPGFGSLAEPVMGVVNINTAPLSVLRMLPMLSPALGFDSITTLDDWWDIGGNGLFAVPTLEIVDIAAAVQAYRDKIMVPHRAAAEPELNYLDDNGGQVLPDDPINFNGRSLTTGTDAIREQPGFASIGEVMAVVNGSTASSMDTLGLDGLSIDHNGVEFTRVRNGSTNGLADDLLDDYDEQLVIANALMNSISVRSDIFCAWFVVHGYQRSDVEGLDPEEPMLPSIARRYMMVIDRSNVTRSGEKPRILLFEEVPL